MWFPCYRSACDQQPIAIVLIDGLATSGIIIILVFPGVYGIIKNLLKSEAGSQMKSVADSLMFKYRGFVGVICLLPVGIAVIFSTPFIAKNAYIYFIADILGWLCFGLYVTFRIWATLYVGGRKDKELQTQGPYSITRNPLYFGTFCFALSVSFFLESISLVAATVITMIIYFRWVVAVEECVLLKTFGSAYSNYRKNTPRFIPRFSQYCAAGFVQVNLGALKTETKRLWFAATLPVIAERIMYLRAASWWPHWFTLH
ncbi:MAG: isoprenylcysteine carboxylmethyltransferase family protein [Planctomycetia bacterium]|nr:isoprenylcysteine carboxylmethyltransferase family protein [Candidatus Brocadia sp.]QOJ05226.1 MAG: isoprenylcysteine carboxylmethyltransferase family protein [Planctomycetia bacterium]TVL96728.1 MAG: hypothetical protein CV082_06070 [Candidatus Brocadia sp. BL1]HQU32663.1 isoprenylcysteine carboxylmethyltransferase family protein [Candidatus Brocadia sapporoensis]